jgi:undecaprenyl diphosphate synthase
LQARTQVELGELFGLFRSLTERAKRIQEENSTYPIRIRFIGDLKELPKDIQQMMSKISAETLTNTYATVTIGINYGGRDELVRAVRQALMRDLEPGELTPEVFSGFLDTCGLPDPDLVVRTGARSRMSGFMPWQTAYSELYFTDTLWPDFSEAELDKAIAFFQNTQRNFGK